MDRETNVFTCKYSFYLCAWNPREPYGANEACDLSLRHVPLTHVLEYEARAPGPCTGWPSSLLSVLQQLELLTKLHYIASPITISKFRVTHGDAPVQNRL
ncbi:hypothetical protein AMTRI_Chr04g246950 [Amborella trichopoda]